MTRKLTTTLIILVLIFVMACSSAAQPTTTNIVVIPTNTATPSILTCEQIEAVEDEIRDGLTSAQWDLPNEYDTYIESIKGKPFQFSGVIQDVSISPSGEVSVFVDIDSCDWIHLSGIPAETAINLSKEQPVSGTGVISQEYQKNLIIHIDVTEFNY